MAKSTRRSNKLPTNRTLEAAVKTAVPRVWAAISADVDWPVTLDEAVELCLDADRPVACNEMTPDEYKAMLNEDAKTVDGWARAALRTYF